LANNGLYDFGRFRLDVSAGQLFVGNESVKIAPKVFQCLVLLVESEGRIVSREEFFTQIWAETFVEDSSLSFTISQLRKTLAEYDEQTKYIETVPRRGFRFQAEIRKSGLPEHLAVRNGPMVLERESIEEVWIEESDADVSAQIPPADPGRLLPGKKQNSVKFFLGFAAVTLIFAVLIGGFYWRNSGQNSGTVKSIAVLPLNELDKDDRDKSLSVGLTDALITQLGKSERLLVRPLNSVLSVSKDDPEALSVGKKLRVDAVLEWSSQKIGDRLRITARLLQVSDGKQLWSETFEEKENDIFKIQDAVSIRVANLLVANLTKREREIIHTRKTLNNEAYEAYLRGRYHWNKRDFEGFTKAQSFFEQAATLDPKFADAHAGLADVQLGFYDYGYKKADETIPKALNAVNRSLQLDPNHSDAYSTLASIEFLYNKNWKATEENFKRSIELAPNNPTTRLRYGWMLSVVGRFEEGLKELEIADKLDPVSRIGQTNIAYNHLVSKRFDEAEAKLKNVIRIHSDFSLPYWYLGTLYFEQEKKQESLEQYFKAFELDEGNSALINKIKELRTTTDEAEVLEFWREELEKRYAENYFPPTNIALVAALEKNREKTLYWLQESEKVRDPWLLQIIYDGEYRFLQGDAEFERILKQVRFN
jgi:DNA-binding winged helix-turn-helix (wHTH) protein/TolB-like protein/Tfp pilus assembly protein PilF